MSGEGQLFSTIFQFTTFGLCTIQKNVINAKAKIHRPAEDPAESDSLGKESGALQFYNNKHCV